MKACSSDEIYNLGSRSYSLENFSKKFSLFWFPTHFFAFKIRLKCKFAGWMQFKAYLLIIAGSSGRKRFFISIYLQLWKFCSSNDIKSYKKPKYISLFFRSPDQQFYSFASQKYLKLKPRHQKSQAVSNLNKK